MSFAWQDADAGLRVVVAGGNGGIGKALVDALLERPGVASIHVLSRSPEPAGASDDAVKAIADRPDRRLEWLQADIGSEESLAALADHVAAPLDLILVATGVLHGDDFAPERRSRDLNSAAMLEVLRINTVVPALIGKHFLPLLNKRRTAAFAALSARVGSIDDNRLGGWTSYRASKAALNMVLKNFAIEFGRSHPLAIVAGLHPGTVDTALSKPFTARVPAEQLFTPQRSAACLLDVIGRLEPDDSGGVFAWDGQRIPW